MRRHTPENAGPVRVLCDEIDFPFDPRMERADVLVAFVRELVGQVAHQHDITGRIAAFTGKPASTNAEEVLTLTEQMLSSKSRAGLIEGAKLVHDACHVLNPDDAYPTDHAIDMLSSCASAVRFGLEMPCHSRHAAAAAQHVWKRIYGVSLFDDHTPAWESEWTRAMLQRALISMLPPSPASLETPSSDGEGPSLEARPNP